MFIESFDGTRLFYEKNSSDSKKKTLLFIHGGFQGNHTSVKKLIDQFKEYNIIAPDLRGRGLSSFPKDVNSVKLEDYAKDLMEIMKNENLKKITLIGSSFGGLVSLKFSTMFQDKVNIENIILLSSAHRLDKLRKRTKLFGSLYIPLANIVSKLADPLKIWSNGKADYSDMNGGALNLKYGVKLLKNNSVKAMTLRFRMMKAAREYRLSKDELKSIKSNILVLYGKKDFFFPMSVQKELLENTNSKLEIIEGAGHNIHVNKTKDVSQIISEFLN